MSKYSTYDTKEIEDYLYLSDKTKNNCKVLMSQKLGMKIYNQNRISLMLQFSGIF